LAIARWHYRTKMLIKVKFLAKSPEKSPVLGLVSEICGDDGGADGLINEFLMENGYVSILIHSNLKMDLGVRRVLDCSAFTKSGSSVPIK
jgi:hypothetical protein